VNSGANKDFQRDLPGGIAASMSFGTFLHFKGSDGMPEFQTTKSNMWTLCSKHQNHKHDDKNQTERTTANPDVISQTR
jgi:hypothetical protein